MSNDINNPSNETTRFEEAKRKVTSFVKRNKNVILTSAGIAAGALVVSALSNKNTEALSEFDNETEGLSEFENEIAELERPGITVMDGPNLMFVYTDTNEFDQRDAMFTLHTLREKEIVDEDFDMNDYWNVEDFI